MMSGWNSRSARSKSGRVTTRRAVKSSAALRSSTSTSSASASSSSSRRMRTVMPQGWRRATGGEVGKSPELGGGDYLEFRPHEPDLDGVADQTGHAMDAEAVHELGAVSLHGLKGDVEAARDFLVRMTFGDELKHLPLPGCEHRVRARALRVRRDDTLGQ